MVTNYIILNFMRVDEDRDKRIDDLVRLNNKKYREVKSQEIQKEFFQRIQEKEGRDKLKEYAKHIQEVNQRRIKQLKEKEVEKQKEIERKKREKIERKKRLEEEKEEKKRKAKQEQIKSRRRRNSMEIEEINKKVEEMAHQQLKRIKSGKLLVETEKEMKKMKLRELEEKRREILAKTKKVSIFAPEAQNSLKQNVDDNVEEGYCAAKEMASRRYKEDIVMNKLIQDGGYESFGNQKGLKQPISLIQEEQNEEEQEQQEEEEDSEEEEELEEDESFKWAEGVVDDKSFSYQQYCREPPTKITERKQQQIAKILNTSSESETEDHPSFQFNQDIFTLSSSELFQRQYLRI